MHMDVSVVLDRDVDSEVLKPGAPTTAELAECTCPDFCERDHDTD
jgi:hypothetical protein